MRSASIKRKSTLSKGRSCANGNRGPQCKKKLAGKRFEGVADAEQAIARLLQSVSDQWHELTSTREATEVVVKRRGRPKAGAVPETRTE